MTDEKNIEPDKKEPEIDPATEAEEDEEFLEDDVPIFEEEDMELEDDEEVLLQEVKKPQPKKVIEKPATKTAFVTGGTGFVGYNLILELLNQGWKVYAAHRKTSDTTKLKKLDVTLIEADITSFASLVVVMPEKLDAVFHVAGNTSVWKEKNEDQYIENVEGTRNMVNTSLQKKVKRFIYTSSTSAYGIHDKRIDENTKSNAYATGINYCITKFEAEDEVRRGIARGLDAVILNPPHIMGPHDIHNWVQMFTLVYQDKVPGIPSGVGEYAHVKDIVNAHISAYQHGRTGENYILGGVEASYKEVFNKIQELMGRKKSTRVTPKWVLSMAAFFMGLASDWFTGKEPTVTPEKVKMLTHKTVYDSKKAIEELGYHITPLEETIKDTYDWMKYEGYFDKEKE